MNKFIEKYKMLSKPAKASFWFVVSNVMLRGISFITLPIFSRLLSTSEYGVISVYQSWVSTISIITTLTIWGGVFNVGMVKYSDQQKELISTFQGLATTITLFFLVISCAFLPIISKWLGMSQGLTLLMYLEILVQIPLNIWSTEQRYKFEYKKLIFVTIAISLLNPLIGVIAVTHTTHRAEARIISSFSIQAVIGIVLFIHNQKQGKNFFDKNFWKYGFLFNVVLIPHYLSTQILSQADRVMINSICGSSDAGIYSVAYNFGMLLSIITNGINSSLTPYIYQCMKQRELKKLKKQTTAIILIVALITLVLVCITPDVFTFLLPDSYYPAIWVIPPVAAGAFFLFLYPLFGSIEFYYEENRYVTASSVMGAALNVVLNYIFIKRFGYIAAAYTTLFCYICFSVFHYIFMKKILKKSGEENVYDIKAIVLISIGLLLATFIMLSVYNLQIIRWSLIVIVVLICLIKRKWIMQILKNMKKEDA